MLGDANGFARGAGGGEGAGEATGAGVDAGVAAGPVVGAGAGSTGRADGADLPPHAAAATRRTNERERVFTGEAYTVEASERGRYSS